MLMSHRIDDHLRSSEARLRIKQLNALVDDRSVLLTPMLFPFSGFSEKVEGSSMLAHQHGDEPWAHPEPDRRLGMA